MKYSEPEKISASVFAKKKGISTSAMYELLYAAGYLVKQGDKAELTEEGKSAGGEIFTSKKFGEYVVWPENLKLANAPEGISEQRLITATSIGEHFTISAKKANYMLSELGWITKSLKGWTVTDYGKKLGGVQSKHKTSGVSYVRWPEAIVNIGALRDSASQITGKNSSQSADSEKETSASTSFREKFPARHRAMDGHMVRSKAEMLIDNWFYMADIAHAYERKLPIEESAYCDFYIPSGKVYIEYWGYENDSTYLTRKKEKTALYNKYNFNLIELKDEHVQNLDDILPRLLLEFGIKAY